MLSAQLGQVDARVEGLRSELRLREAELETERLKLQSMESDLEQAQTRAYEADNEVKLLESQIAHRLQALEGLKEREAQAKSELSGLHGQREELQGEARTIAARLDALRDDEQAQADVLERETEELERRRAGAQEAEQALEAARARVSEAERRIARAEAALGGLEQRKSDQRQRLERIDTERRDLEARITELGQEADELKARLGGMRGDKDEIGKHRGELEEELAKLREEIVQSDERVEQLRSTLAEKRSRLRSLEEIQQRFEGVGAGVRAVMTGFGGGDTGHRVQGLVADRFECAPELTRALAAALGEKLQYVVVDDLDTGVDAVRYLSEGKRGRATLIPSTPSGDGFGRSQPPMRPGVIGRLQDLVEVPSEDQALATRLLGDVIVVEDLEVARTIHGEGQGEMLLVTRDGQVLAPDGTLSGGDGEDAGAHLIEVKREVRELQDQVAELSGQMDAANAHPGSLRNAIAQRQAALESTRSDAHEQEIGMVKAERDLHRVENAVGDSRARLESLGEEAQSITALLDGSGDDEEQARRERVAAEEDRAQASAGLAAADEVVRARRASVEEQNTVVTEVRVKAAQAKQKVEGDQAVMERLQRSLEELDAREARLGQDLRDFSERQGELSGGVARDREDQGAKVREAMRVGEDVGQLRATYEEARGALGALEAELREQRLSIENDSKQLSNLSLEEREASLALQHLIEGAMEKHRVDVRKVLTDYHDRPVPDENVHNRIAELQRIVERMGEINLTAIEEYEERSERYEYLTAQRTDLQTALDQLERAIRQMNRKSRKMFREAFDEVNARFKVMFPKMFGGGKAELRLTEAEDILDAGIDIVAQPPGKKLTSIELMSGGEKALTAVSLIFSLFSYRPSPFCLLDEVDAPLDEANIARYCEMIRTMTDRSQFILITHSKTTMELGDVMYGVTMETPGISKLVKVNLKHEGDDAAGDTDGEQGDVAVA